MPPGHGRRGLIVQWHLYKCVGSYRSAAPGFIKRCKHIPISAVGMNDTTSPLGDYVIIGGVVIPNACEESYIIDFIIV